MSYALLIDDDDGLVASIKRAATLSDLDLVTASSWEEGLSLFHALGPNLVIADYHMPGSRHGLQLLAEIKSIRPSVHVVLMSAYINDDDVARILGLQVIDGALRKLSLVATSEAILDLINQASRRASEPTDWKAVAAATVRAAGHSEAELEQLDTWLRERSPKR